MKARLVMAALATVMAALLLAGCGEEKEAQAPASAARGAPPQSGNFYDAVAARAAGFSVGNMMASRVVYVFFDAQCPHCGRLWREAKPVLGQVRMVWIPIRFLSDLSGRQGAALLASRDAALDMDRHEESLLAGGRGMVPPGEISADLLAKVKANTELMTSNGGGSVPYIVFKNPATGQALTFEGAVDTEGLRKLLNLG